jgi:hypothetical protein
MYLHDGSFRACLTKPSRGGFVPRSQPVDHTLDLFTPEQLEIPGVAVQERRGKGFTRPHGDEGIPRDASSEHRQTQIRKSPAGLAKLQIPVMVPHGGIEPPTRRFSDRE